MQLNKPRIQPTEKQQTKINGNSIVVNASVTEQKMGEIIYTEDSTSSGMFRKPEMPNTLQLVISGNEVPEKQKFTNDPRTPFQKKEKAECPVRYLSRSEVASNTRGVFRMDNAETPLSLASPAAATLPQKISSLPVSGAIAKRLPVARPANSPITVGQRQQVLRTPGQGLATTALQRRPVVGSTPQVRQNQQLTPARAHPSGRILARAGTPQQRQQQQAAAYQGGKAVTPEQKILQLSKSGDLKVTRKVVTREEMMAQRAAQARQQRQVQAQQQQQQSSQVQIQKVSAGRQRIAPKATVQPTPLQMELDEEVHQHQAQLCPITGKLIGQEETQLQMEQEQQQEQQREQLEAAAQALLGDQSVLTNEDGSALLVRGEDGTVYQVAGKNAEGQTILVTQGPDGEQQFAYVAAAEGEEQDVLSLDHAVAEAVQAGEQVEAHGAAGATADEQILVSMTEEELAHHQAAGLQQQATGTATPATAQIHITTSDSDGTEAQIPAEVVQADLPSPGELQ